MTERIGEEALEDLIDFVRDAIDQILLREDEREFFAWVRAEAPRRFEEDFARLSGERAVRATAFEVAREIWNKVPLPGAGYRIRPIPRPERNDRCPCGSGQKHKRCCGAASGGRLVRPLTEADGWFFVLLRRPPEEVARVSSEGLVPRAALPGIADDLLDFDKPEIALALLEPFFENPQRLTERDASAVEALIDAYETLELHDRKETAIERLRVELPPPLRLVLWESFGPSLVAQRETGRAWEAAEEIRRLDPDSPVLGAMEVMLLLEENRLPEAAGRARDALWRHPHKPGLNHRALALLRITADDPAAGLRQMLLGAMRESVDALERLLRNVSDRPIRPYAVFLEALAPEHGLLRAPDDLGMIEDQWLAATAGMKWGPEEGEPEGEEDDDDLEQDEEDGGSWDFGGGEEDEEDEVDWSDEEMWAFDRANPWLAWLGWTPQAFDSLLVLSNLATGVLMLARRDPVLRETLLAPLVARGLAILDASLAAVPQVTALPGDLEENFPALDLLDISARLSEPDLDVKALERLLELDPADSLHVRGELAVAYLKAGEPQKTLDLAGCGGGDKENADLAFAKVIALHRLQRTDEAFATLDDALGDYPLSALWVATADPGDVLNPLCALWRKEEELWLRLRRWAEEQPPEEMERLLGNLN